MSDDSSDDEAENQCEELKEDQESTPIDDLISFEDKPAQVLQPQKNFESKLNMQDVNSPMIDMEAKPQMTMQNTNLYG